MGLKSRGKYRSSSELYLLFTRLSEGWNQINAWFYFSRCKKSVECSGSVLSTTFETLLDLFKSALHSIRLTSFQIKAYSLRLDYSVYKLIYQGTIDNLSIGSLKNWISFIWLINWFLVAYCQQNIRDYRSLGHLVSQVVSENRIKTALGLHNPRCTLIWLPWEFRYWLRNIFQKSFWLQSFFSLKWSSMHDGEYFYRPHRQQQIFWQNFWRLITWILHRLCWFRFQEALLFHYIRNAK